MSLYKKLKIAYYANKLYRKLKGGIKMKKLLEREFILTILTIIASLFSALSGVIPADLMLKIMASVTMVYAVARAIVKFTPTQKDDKLLADIEKIFKKK